MSIDSSAIIAVINGEPEATQFAHAIAANVCRISAVEVPYRFRTVGHIS